MKTHKKPELTPTEYAAEHVLERRAKGERWDAIATSKGYEVTGAGEKGSTLEANLLQPLNAPKFENLRRHPESQESTKDDNVAINRALKSSALTDVYADKHLYMSEWLNTLHQKIARIMHQRKIWEGLAVDEAEIMRMIKPVPCLGVKSMDYDRGVDFFFVFHEPMTFAEQEFRNPQQEATYWNSKEDTVVNCDLTAQLATKFKNKNHTFRSDIYASKLGSAVNHYLRQAVGDDVFPEEIGGTQQVRNEDARLTVTAARIVDAYLIKSGKIGGKKLDHIYSPEREKERKIEDLRSENRSKHEKALKRKREEDAKKAKRREQGMLAKQQKAERKGQQ